VNGAGTRSGGMHRIDGCVACSRVKQQKHVHIWSVAVENNAPICQVRLAGRALPAGGGPGLSRVG